jgi:serine protease Do
VRATCTSGKAKRLLNTLALIAHTTVAAGALSACSTVGTYLGTDRPPIGYTAFFDEGDHVAGLLDADHVEQASKVYSQNIAYFAAKSGERKELVTRLAAQLNRKLEPQLTVAANGIISLPLTTRPGEWATFKAALDNAGKVLSEYESHAVLKSHTFESPVYRRAKDALVKVTARLKAEAADAFIAYPEISRRNFFEQYPVPLGEEVAVTALSRIRDRLVSGDGSEIEGFVKLYADKKWLDEPTRLHLGRTLASKKFAALPSGRATIGDVIAIAQSAAAAGFRKDATSHLIKVVVLSGGGDFPVAFDEDLPIVVERTTDVSSIGSQDSAFTIVVRPRTAVAERKVTARNKKSSAFVSGYRSEPNPEYAAAQAKFINAQSNLNSVRIQNATTPPGTGWAAVLSGIAKGISEAAAQSQVDDAVKQVQQTPATVQREILDSYEYMETAGEIRRMSEVVVAVLRKDAPNIVAVHSHSAGKTKPFTVAYGVHDRDPNRYRLLSSAVTEEDLARSEAEPLKVPISAVVKSVSANPEIVPRPALLATLTVNRGSGSSVRPEIPAATRPRTNHDSRFESVVLIRTPTGKLGSGFFVRPGYVLTNWHVVDGSSYTDVKTHNGEELAGKVVATDISRDLALVRTGGHGRPLELHRGTVASGASVEAIGHPKGLEFSITRGVVSGIRDMPTPKTAGKKITHIQTDTALNTGNSGGPLMIGDKVAGVITFAMRDAQGLNFAVHASEVDQFLQENMPR